MRICPVVGSRKESIGLVLPQTSKKWDIQWLVSFTLWVLYKPQTHNYSYENAQCNLGSKEGIELKGVCDIIIGILFSVMDVLEEKNR